MNDKEIATWLREQAIETTDKVTREALNKKADELDSPSIPAPGTPILWRRNRTLNWRHGIVEVCGVVRDQNSNWEYLSTVIWKPAPIAKEGEVIVNRSDLVGALARIHASEGVAQRLYEALGEAVDDR